MTLNYDDFCTFAHHHYTIKIQCLKMSLMSKYNNLFMKKDEAKLDYKFKVLKIENNKATIKFIGTKNSKKSD